MAIGKISSPSRRVSIPESAAAIPAVGKKAAADLSSVSTFSAAAETSNSKSKHSDVNDYLKGGMTDLEAKAGEGAASPAGIQMQMLLGSSMFGKSGESHVMEKVNKYVKDHPDADLKEVSSYLQSEAMSYGIVLKMLEAGIKKATSRPSTG
jgi:hypothetical protein